MSASSRRWIAIPQAAELLSTSPSAIRRLLGWGLLPYRRVAPRSIQIPADVVSRWAANGTGLLEAWQRGELSADEVRRRLD